MGEEIIYQALTGSTAICSAGRPLTPGLAPISAQVQGDRVLLTLEPKSLTVIAIRP